MFAELLLLLPRNAALLLVLCLAVLIALPWMLVIRPTPRQAMPRLLRQRRLQWRPGVALQGWAWARALTRATVLLMCLSLWALYGCGTAPLPANSALQPWPPIPARLMTPPQAPVLLVPGSTSETPGSTTLPTPPAARKTAVS